MTDFKKSSLTCIWNFLFGIFLRCLTGRTIGLDIAKLAVYATVTGLYYDIQFDYASQIWKEYGNRFANINVVNGVSCAHYCSLILMYIYEKEGILVPIEVPKVGFNIYQHPKNIKEDSEILPTIARIPHIMLHKVDPANPVRIAYIQTMKPTIETSVLLPKGVANPSKITKGSRNVV